MYLSIPRLSISTAPVGWGGSFESVKMPEAASRIPEIVVLEPRDLSEISLAIQALRSQQVVILKLTNLESDQAQRAADFVTGGTYAIAGHTELIGERTFLFTPSGVQVIR